MLEDYKWVREKKNLHYAIVKWRLISFFDEPAVIWKVEENKKTKEVVATPIEVVPKLPYESLEYFRLICEASREIVVVFGPFTLKTKSISVQIYDLDTENPVSNELKKVGLF